MIPNHNKENIIPPPPPTTIEGLMHEMFGVFDSCPALYQGMLRYWLMWRLPQIINSIKESPGLKFHLCTTYQGLLKNFLRIFILPDLLVVGQSGHVLQYEMLQYEHSFERPWPNIDGTQPVLGAIGMKPDRPIVDGVVQFLYEWIRPLSPSGRVLFAPFTTMLAGPTLDSLSSEIITELLKSSISDAKPEGIPGITIRDIMEQAAIELERHPDKKSVPLDLSGGLKERKVLREKFDLSKMELKYGRYFYPSIQISQPDPIWGPSEILAFEFFLANQLGSMLVVADDWCKVVPTPAHKLNLSLPFVDGISAPLLAKIITDDPETFGNFRKTISSALIEALNARGSEDFSRQLKRIQRDIINDGISKLNGKWDDFKRMRLARFGKYAVRSISITIGLYFMFSPAALAGLFTTSIVSIFNEIEKRIAEKKEMKENPMYFIWKIGY